METEPQIIRQYIATGKVRLIYRHLFQLGDGSLRAGEASECAAAQGQFWQMRETLYRRQAELYGSADLDATLAGFANDMGLNTASFGECMASHTYLEAIQADFAAAQAEGIRSRPVFAIGDQRIIGARPFEAFQPVIDEALAR